MYVRVEESPRQREACKRREVLEDLVVNDDCQTIGVAELTKGSEAGEWSK